MRFAGTFEAVYHPAWTLNDFYLHGERLFTKVMAFLVATVAYSGTSQRIIDADFLTIQFRLCRCDAIHETLQDRAALTFLSLQARKKYFVLLEPLFDVVLPTVRTVIVRAKPVTIKICSVFTDGAHAFDSALLSALQSLVFAGELLIVVVIVTVLELFTIPLVDVEHVQSQIMVDTHLSVQLVHLLCNRVEQLRLRDEFNLQRL